MTLAYKLLKSANLSPDHEKLAKATCELKYNSMKEQLKKIFSDTKTSHIPSIPSLKVDEINQCSAVTHHQLMTSGHDISNNCVQHQYGVHDTGDDYCEETFYTRSPNNRPYNNRSTTRYQQQSQNNVGNRRPSFSPQYNQNKVTFERKGRNPSDPAGKITRCEICDSINHWAPQCPDKRNWRSNQTFYTNDQSYDDYTSDQITLFQSDFDHPQQLKGLIAESWLHAVLDCGASKTVCGLVWLKSHFK